MTMVYEEYHDDDDNDYDDADYQLTLFRNRRACSRMVGFFFTYIVELMAYEYLFAIKHISIIINYEHVRLCDIRIETF